MATTKKVAEYLFGAKFIGFCGWVELLEQFYHQPYQQGEKLISENEQEFAKFFMYVKSERNCSEFSVVEVISAMRYILSL